MNGNGDDLGEMSALSPPQAAFRFLIELVALACLGVTGWQIGSGITRWILMIGFVVVAGGLWGTFRVPGDASASGEAPVPVPGILRLLLELGLLLGAALLTIAVWQPAVGIVLGGAVVVHYATTGRRVRWLLTRGSAEHRDATG